MWEYTEAGFGRYGVSFNTTSNSSEVTFYTTDRSCDNFEQLLKRYKLGNIENNRNDQYTTSTETATPSERPHLSEIVGMELSQDKDVLDCQHYKIWDTKTENGEIIKRLYQDFLIYLQSIFPGLRQYKIVNRQIAEERIKFIGTSDENIRYQIQNDFLNGKRRLQGTRVITRGNVINGRVFIDIDAFTIYDNPFSPVLKIPTNAMRFGFEMNENDMEKMNLKLAMGSDKILDAWIQSPSNQVYSAMKYFTGELLPRYLRSKTFLNTLY